MAGRGRGLEAALPAWMTEKKTAQPIGQPSLDQVGIAKPPGGISSVPPSLGSQGLSPAQLMQSGLGASGVPSRPGVTSAPPSNLSVLPPHLFPQGMMPPKLPPPPPASLVSQAMQRPPQQQTPGAANLSIPAGMPPSTGGTPSGLPPPSMPAGTPPTGASPGKPLSSVPQAAPPAGLPPGAIPPAGMPPPGSLPAGMPPGMPKPGQLPPGMPPGVSMSMPPPGSLPAGMPPGMPSGQLPPGMPPTGMPPGMPPGSRPPPGIPPPHLMAAQMGGGPPGGFANPATGAAGTSAPAASGTTPLPTPPPGLPPGVQLQQQQQQQPPATAAPGGGAAPGGTPATGGGGNKGWTEHKSPDGRKYFYNATTKQSSWEKPKELMTALELADAMTPWREWTAPDGRKFYYNKETKQSKWTIPPELQKAREQAAQTHSQAAAAAAATPTPSPATAPPASTPPVFLQAGSMPGVPGANTAAANGTTAGPMGVPPGAAHPSGLTSDSSAPSSTATPTPGNNNNNNITTPATPSAPVVEAPKVNVSQSAPIAVTKTPITYATKQEAKDAFKAMLTSCGVKSDWSWEAAMRAVISDDRYSALKTLGEKKSCFNEWAQMRGKQEKEEQRLKAKKTREDFKTMLFEKEELKGWMRFSEAQALFEREPKWQAVESQRERSELFDDVRVEVQKREKEQKKQLRKERMAGFRKLLEETSSVKVDSQWRKVYEKLEDDPVCQQLDPADRLEVFQDYIRDLEKLEKEQKVVEKEQRRRQERKNREGFKELLARHSQEGAEAKPALITPKTTWKEYLLVCKHEDAYQALCSNLSGSKPRELFDDCMEALEKQYEKDRTCVKDAIKLQKWTLKSDSTFQELEEVVTKVEGGIGEKIKAMTQSGLQLVFSELVERAAHREEKEAKRRKRAVLDFQDMLHSFREIKEATTWEECKDIVQSEPEYKALEDDTVAEQAFEAFIEELKVKAAEKAERRAKEKKEKKSDDREDRHKKKKHKRKHRSDSEHSDGGNTSEEEAQRKKRHKKSKKHDDEDEDEDEDRKQGRKEEKRSREKKRETEDEEDGEIR